METTIARRRSALRGLLVIAALFPSPFISASEGALRPVSAPAAGWPQFRGPRRDAVSAEIRLLEEWPAEGPPLLWRISGLGRGYSSPIIAAGKIFLTGDVDDDLKIFALDLDGKLLFTAANGRSWRGPYPGARASLSFEDGRLYHMNAHGRVACFDASSGSEIWAVDVRERFDARLNTWGYSECVLLDGPRAIVTPGGRKATMAALDRRTGETLWAAGPVTLDSDEISAGEEFPDAENPIDIASYASAALFEIGNRRFVAGVSSRHIFCVEAETGNLAWKHPIRTIYQVLAIVPVIVPEGVFMTAPDSGGGRLYRLEIQGARLKGKPAWTAAIDTCTGGAIVAGGILFGSWYREYDGWGAVDLSSGETLYQTRELLRGSALYADGRFYCLAEDGTAALVEADRKAVRIVSRFRLRDLRTRDAWAHPVLLDGRLYLRYHEDLECRDVRVHRASEASGD